MQRRIIDALTGHYSADTVPPLTWFTREGLAMTDVSRQSYSRAAVTLQREGLIDRGLLYRFGNTSTNPHYKHARSVIHADDHAEWNQGPRLTLVVRSAATPELAAEWREFSDRAEMLLNSRSPMHRTYADWFYSHGVEGAAPHSDDEDFGVHELPVEGSLEVTRAAISARTRDRGML